MRLTLRQLHKIGATVNYIGFQFNYSADTKPRRRLTPSLINRIVLIDDRLRDAGFRLFLHSPHEIKPHTMTVPGFVFRNGDLLPVTGRVPIVNGNWTHRTRRLLAKGMGYDAFGAWSAAHGIHIYVPHAFSELVGDKLETYKLVRAYHETLHPHCEPFARTVRQMEHFVETGCAAFVKPRRGSKGNHIVTVRNEASGLGVTHYHEGERRHARFRSMREVMGFVREVTPSDRTYVIQRGVETIRHDGAVFDIRVTMLHDGVAWHWLHEARLSPEGSDISNVRQGGEITATEDLLFEAVGAESARQILHDLGNESFGLANYLGQLHPGEILEVAFDFVVDTRGELRLLEINTKPGLAGIGSDVSVFDKRAAHEPLFERWVYPHTKYLAEFLLRKARDFVASPATA